MPEAPDSYSSRGFGQLTQLTRNKRLSRVLQQRAADRESAGGALAWRSSDILPLPAFCQRLWDEHGLFQSSLRQLSLAQARALWLELGASLREFDRLGFRERVLDSMFDAYCLCGNWGMNSRDLSGAMKNEDQSLFAILCARFDEVLQERRLFSSSHLIEQLLKLDLAPRNGVARHIELHGFLSFSVSETALIEKLESSGDKVLVIEPSAADFKHAERCELPDRDQELLAAGHWAREELLAKPESRLAIVVPELSRDTDRKLRLIHDGLRPGWQFDPDTLSDINTSMGRPLLAYPWFQSLVLGMEALLKPMPFRVVSAFLRDPGLAGDSRSDCALLELRLRELSEQHWQFSDLMRFLPAEERELPFAVQLNTWAELEAELAEHNAPQTPEFWAKFFDKTTLALLPSNPPTVSSLEFRLRNSWRDALNNLASLGLVQALISKSAGWAFILQSLASTLYQPEVHHGRLEVLGPLEAIDHDYDAVWISGLDNKSWPPTTRANAYIPRSLQSKLKMPGSDPVLDRAFAQRALSALAATAARVFVSSACNDQDIELHPTDAIASLGLMNDNDLPASIRFAESSIGQATYSDCRLDEFIALAESEPVRGGSGILSLQNEYPLAAFVQYRLGAAPLRRPIDGVGAMVRGRIIHSAAQQLYSSGRSNALSASLETISALCAQAVRPFRNSRDRLLQLLLDREAERTVGILQSLQVLDAERPVFEVQDVERSMTVSFDTLELRLQLDRLDQLSDGLLILDYKTGRNMKAISTAGMPGELQLAIYAHALMQTGDKPIAAVGICQLHSSRVGYKGIESGIDEGDFSVFCKKNTQANLLSSWSAEVVRLAREFELGRAGIPEKSNYADASLYDVFASSKVATDD